MRKQLLASGLVAICPALAIAQTEAGGSRFGHLDVNGDGIISADELGADAGLKAHFSEMDSDHNGSVSSGEFSAFEELRDSGSVIDDERRIRTDDERGKNSNRAGNEPAKDAIVRLS